MAKRKLNRRQQWRIEKIQAEKRDRANRRNDQQEDLVAEVRQAYACNDAVFAELTRHLS